MVARVRGRGKRYPERLRGRVTAWARQRRDGGASLQVVSKELGLSMETVRRMDAMLVTFLGSMLWTGRGVGVERDVLIAFDLLLVLVLGLLLYSVSARDPVSPPDAFDVMQVVLVVSALLADAVALWAIAARITEFGFSPNRVAALGVAIAVIVFPPLFGHT